MLGLTGAREEVAEERERDPINTFVDRLTDAGIITDDEVEEMDQKVIAAVEEAAEFADASPVPGPEEIYRNVYYDEYRGGADGRDAWR